MRHSQKERNIKLMAIDDLLHIMRSNIEALESSDLNDMNLGAMYHCIDSSIELTKELVREDITDKPNDDVKICLNNDDVKIYLNLNIPLTAFDIEVFKDVIYNDEQVDWVFNADTGETINLAFTKDEGE